MRPCAATRERDIVRAGQDCSRPAEIQGRDTHGLPAAQVHRGRCRSNVQRIPQTGQRAREIHSPAWGPRGARYPREVVGPTNVHRPGGHIECSGSCHGGCGRQRVRAPSKLECRAVRDVISADVGPAAIGESQRACLHFNPVKARARIRDGDTKGDGVRADRPP